MEGEISSSEMQTLSLFSVPYFSLLFICYTEQIHSWWRLWLWFDYYYDYCCAWLPFTVTDNVCGWQSLMFFFFPQLADLRIKYVDLEQSENLESHRTNGFRNTKSLVVRRGAPFKVSVQLEGRPFSPKIDTLRVKVMLGTFLDILLGCFCIQVV